MNNEFAGKESEEGKVMWKQSHMLLSDRLTGRPRYYGLEIDSFGLVESSSRKYPPLLTFSI